MISHFQAADRRTPCQVHVLLFVPADHRPPPGYQPRVDEIVAYADGFFRGGLARWGHRSVVSPFRRSADGRAEVTLLRGKRKAAAYTPVEVRAEVMDELRRQRKVAPDVARHVWWILVYAGDPPRKFPGFLGGFGPQIGGWAVCNFNTAPGRVDPAAPLGSEFLERLMLKGMLHELGHGFQLPHVGPLKRDAAGNTLMGPTHVNYRRVMPAGEPRVYLSEAEAAMLATHPAFRGVPEERGPLPKVEAQDLAYTADPRTGAIVVRGRVRAPGGKLPVYALVADEADARPGEYWTKTYAGKVAPADGSFTVTVNEPYASNGTLRTWFAFDSGAQTGDGKSRGRDSGIPRAYRYGRGTWTFP